ncbi:hypothetical protein MBLNU13_g07485t1 [Cladosporium sp. NU13]
MDIVPSLKSSANEPAPIAPFRFFDLPAELRVKVYEELLTIKPNKTGPIQISRHSQILRASKKCYNESQPILERLNKIQIKVSAFTLVDGLPGDHTFPNIVLKFAGGLQSTLWHAFGHLPISAGTCYDVHQRWQHALQVGGGGGKLNVSLQLAYHSITSVGAEGLLAAIVELEGQGMSHDSICREVLERFRTTKKSIAAGHMSIAEVFQLAFALEHLVSTAPHLPLRFVSAANGVYDRMMDRNHAHELMTTSTKPDAQFLRMLWALMSEWLPASVANFTTRVLLGRHVCRWDFRRDLRLVEKNLSRFKGPLHPRSYSLPYTGPPVVWDLLPAVERFLEQERTRHRQERTSALVGKS